MTVLDASLKTRDVFNGGEGNNVDTTISNSNERVVVKVNGFFEDIFNGEGVVLVILD